MKRFLLVSSLARLAAISTLLFALTACGTISPATKSPATSQRMSGHVQGGQQPVKGAVVSIYATGPEVGGRRYPTSYFLGSTSTDANGNFTLTGVYTCPFPYWNIFVTADRGDPGTGVTNPSLAMITAIGPCGNLTSSTFISINELTTVASVDAMLGHIVSENAISYYDFTLTNELVDISAGTAPGPALPAGYYASTATLNTIADIIAACVNSTGGVAGDHSVCGNLFSLSASSFGLPTPTNTVDAVIGLLLEPTKNVQGIYNLLPPDGPFQPVLTSAPTTFALPIVKLP